MRTKYRFYVKNNSIDISFGFDGTRIGSHQSLLGRGALRFIRPSSSSQSSDDIYLVYCGWCSDNVSSGGLEEIKETCQELGEKISVEGIEVLGITYSIKLES